MSLMQGFIYVENELSPRYKFQPRYFVLFPFCGLRWFLEEPKEKNIPKLLLSAQEGGWVYGGNVRVHDVILEEAIPYNTLTVDSVLIYPFVLELICGTNIHKLRLGCDDPETRYQWMEEMTKSLHIQHYLYSCVECGATPSKSIFCSALANQPSVILENLQMTIPTLGSLVMLCKLNENHGTSLNAVHLENAQMGDHHIPLITSLLSFTPQLQSLSLANNYFTDDGITQFSSSLLACPLLIVLDLSNNFFGDKGMLALEPSLRALKSLGHLDLSRNRLTKESAKSLAFAIARYGSLLTSINLSYNVMGDDVAALSVLLLTTEATAIENINLSFCGISSLGLTELAHALVGCESLHNLSLQGNFGDEKSSILLLDAMTAHQRKFGVSPPLSELTDDSGFQSRNFRKKSALCIHLGGLVIEDQPLSIEHKTMRMAIAYGSQYSTLTRTVLSRRVAQHPPKPSTDPKVQHHYLPNESMVCLRVQLLHWMESISDLIEELARSLGADTRQLQLLSASEMDETDSCFVIFVPLEASALAEEAFQRQVTSASASIPGSPGSPRRPIERLSSKIEITSTSLPSVDDILQALVDFSRISSPILRKIGIRTVYIRRRSPNGELCAPFHCHIRGSGYGGQGVLAEFIPPLFPMASVMESVATTSNKQSYDEDEETDEAQSRDRTEFAVTGPEVSERDRVESTVWYDEDDEGDGNEWKENESEGKTDQSEVIENFDLLPSTVLEEVGGNIDQKLTQAIRTLQKEGRIPMDAGVFWHQAFSSEQDGEKVVEILDDALDEDGLFHFVSIRKHLCDAMLRRDVGAMESYLEHMKSHGIPGGAAQALGEQLLSEVLGLMRDGDNLDSLAEGPDDIGIVENFLMACGRIGYSGKETLVAIELREYLVRWALQDNPDYSTELPGIKQRSYVTNLMISRDLDSLRVALDNPDTSTMLSKTQRLTALKLLEDATTVQTKLLNAIESGELEEIENCIAEAAYLNIVDDTLTQAVDTVAELSSDVKSLLSPILENLRTGTIDELNQSLLEAHRVGWDHPFIHKISLLIFEERNRLIQEELIKQKLFQMIADIKAGQSIKQIEIMQLMRRIKSLKLDQNTALQPHIQLLDKQMKRAAGLASLEEEILRLIDERDLVKLTDILSGRGTGRLVMSASAADVMKEWMDALELACQLGVDKSGLQHTVYKTGILEKAARGNEGLRNWRQRFFVLEGLSISYFTKQGGEKKGCVRVGGGAVRILSGEDTGGRNYCFELQEGRDLSNIDPDLLFEARKQVKLMHKDNLEEALVDAVNAQSESRCSSILEKASGLDISLDSDLVAQAKAILVRMQHRALKLELREACQTIPRGQLQELVRTAKRIRLDSSFIYFRIAQLLLEKPESELSILRARGCLHYLDDSTFMRSLASIQRFDIKRLGIKEKTVLVSVLFQYCGMIVTRGFMIDCDFPQNAAKILQQTLDSSMQYFVETEPMQLARNVIDGVTRNHDFSSSKTSTIPREAKPLRRAQSHFDTTTLSGDVKAMSQYVLEKFPNVRPVEAPSRKSFLGRRKSTNADTNFLSFSLEPINHSLLTLQKNDDELACELYKALMVVMGDRAVQSLNGRIFRNLLDEYSIANQLVRTGVNSISLRDELYVQLMKQLNKNSKHTSRVRGWSLLIVYLHSFPPSQPLLPYLRAFISSQSQQSLDQQLQQQQQVVTANTGTTSSVTTAVISSPTNRRNRDTSLLLSKTSDLMDDPQLTELSAVTSYAKKVFLWTECESLATDGFQSDISMIDVALVTDIFKRTPLQIEISVLTGSVYQFSISFGDIDSIFSILGLLLLKMVGPGYSQAVLLKSGLDSTSSSSSQGLLTALKGSEKLATRQDLICKLFRGFWFYSSDSLDGFHDTQALPVQPDETSVMQWQHDFLWDLLQNNSDRLRRLVLRRRVLLSSEDLVNQLDLFRDMAAERDVIGTQRLWSKWLQEKTNDLPIDHCRMDLLFAEETRYVNSQLYALSLEALIYLTALQLTLSLGDDNLGANPGRWGGEHKLVMNNSDASVRPSLAAKNFMVRVASPQRNRGGRSSLASAETGGGSVIDRRGSLERRASGLGNLFKGRSSVQSEGMDVSGGAGDENEDKETPHDHTEVLWCGEVISLNDTREMEILEEKLQSLGISLPSDSTEEIVRTIAEFQTMAKHLNCSVTSQRFRYLLKSAYVTYVMAWPLAGGNFFEGYLDHNSRLEKILICVSGNGLHLLTIEDWLLIFQAPIYDIQSCSISSAARYPVMSTETKLLNITVNEQTLPIITTSAIDIQSLIEVFSLEMLARGAFPHGFEGGNDILDVGESYLLASDSKAVMQRFLRNYPMLPTPPPPCALERSPIYFDPPKSRRAILAEERAEEERIELEQARLAAESHAAKNLAHLEHGKQTLQKFMTEDDDDDEEGEGAGAGEGGVGAGTGAGKKTKKTRRRSGSLSTLTESAESIRNNMITAAVCGVSNRPPLISLAIPPPPVRGVGMRLDSMFGGETSTKPALIGQSTPRQVTGPAVAHTAFKPKFVTPKNVSFPLSVEWPRHAIAAAAFVQPTSEYQSRLSMELHLGDRDRDWDGEDERKGADEEDNLPFPQGEFYGSGYLLLSHHQSGQGQEQQQGTRSRQSSVVLYAGGGGEGEDRALSPASDASLAESGDESSAPIFTRGPMGFPDPEDYEDEDEDPQQQREKGGGQDWEGEEEEQQ